MDGGAWWAAVHGVMKSRTWLSDFTFIFHFHALEKEMATRSSVLAWRIPGMGEPGGLLSMGLHRVRHDWSDLAAAALITKTPSCGHLHNHCWRVIKMIQIVLPTLWDTGYNGHFYGKSLNSILRSQHFVGVCKKTEFPMTLLLLSIWYC